MRLDERRIRALYTRVPVLECECASMSSYFALTGSLQEGRRFLPPSGVAQLVLHSAVGAELRRSMTPGLLYTSFEGWDSRARRLGGCPGGVWFTANGRARSLLVAQVARHSEQQRIRAGDGPCTSSFGNSLGAFTELLMFTTGSPRPCPSSSSASKLS
jgi:hypothetical protein